MGDFADAFATAFRDFNTEGVPASGPYKPVKSIIRAIGALLDKGPKPIYLASGFGINPGLGTDNGPLINAAIVAIAAAGGGVLLFKYLPYGVATTIQHGTGSSSAVSTINGVELRGAGVGFQRQQVGSGALGTKFVWTGTSGGRMYDCQGPCWGNSVVDIAFDGSAAAGYGPRWVSAQNAQIRAQVGRCKSVGAGFYVQAMTSVPSGEDGAIRACAGLIVDLFVDGFTGVQGLGAICVDFDGQPDINFDPTKNNFQRIECIVDLQSGTGIREGFVDSTDYGSVWMQGAGVPDGNAASFRRIGRTVSGAVYPANNTVSGHRQFGQNLPVVVDETLARPGLLWANDPGEFDREGFYDAPAIFSMSFPQIEGNPSSTGGLARVSKVGWGVRSDEFRNLLINCSAMRTSRGANFSNPTSGSVCLDGWAPAYNGTASMNIARQSFSKGAQIPVLGNPPWFHRVAVSAASGQTTFTYEQKVEGADNFSGDRATFGVWLKASTAIQVGFSIIQNFGTGGSPSAEVETQAKYIDGTTTALASVTTNWQFFQFRVAVPSVAGKTFGTAGNDYLRAALRLPLNTAVTVDILPTGLEAGVSGREPERRPAQIDEVMCARYLQTVESPGQVYGHATVNGPNTAVLNVRLSPAMRDAPSLSVSGAASDYLMKAADGTGGGACSSAPTVSSTRGQAQITFTKTAHGFTLGQQVQISRTSNGGLLLSAEF